MQKRAHLLPAVVILISSITGLMQWETAAAPLPQPELHFSISSGDYPLSNRGTTSVRDDLAPFVAPTPVPIPPQALMLPAPAPPVTVSGAVAPIQGSGALRWPVVGRVTTPFQSGHKAIDIEAHCGTAVVAALGGTVTFAGWKNNGGGYVVDINSGGLATTYNHLSAVAVSPGVGVATGQLIAYSGASGWATGCHLHFGVYLNGVPVNPLAYL